MNTIAINIAPTVKLLVLKKIANAEGDDLFSDRRGHLVVRPGSTGGAGRCVS